VLNHLVTFKEALRCVLRQNRQCAYKIILRRVHKPLLHYTAQSVTYSECVSVALGIQHAMRMCHIIICGLHGCKKNISTVGHKRHDSRKQLQNVKYVSNFSTNFVGTFLNLRRTEGDMIKNVYWSLCRTLVLVRF
jgi:hypothetical protein